MTIEKLPIADLKNLGALALQALEIVSMIAGWWFDDSIHYGSSDEEIEKFQDEFHKEHSFPHQRIPEHIERIDAIRRGIMNKMNANGERDVYGNLDL